MIYNKNESKYANDFKNEQSRKCGDEEKVFYTKWKRSKSIHNLVNKYRSNWNSNVLNKYSEMFFRQFGTYKLPK